MAVEMIRSYVRRRFPAFGQNKAREVSRLLFEISKRDRTDIETILREYKGRPQHFKDIRTYLIRKRFPESLRHQKTVRPFLPDLACNPDLKVDLGGDRRRIIPERFFVEEVVAETPFVRGLKRRFPRAQWTVIDRYSDHVRQRPYTLRDYNRRLKAFYIIKEKFDFFKPCPCSPKVVPCGYHLINLGSGCAFECVYCFLQAYINSPGIVLPANIEDFFAQFANYRQQIYLGSGEFTDSLVFDHITEFSPKIVSFFRDYPRSRFEFKTKSDNIDLLKTVRPAGNIVVAWSVNPQNIIDTCEFYTAPLTDRLAAAAACAELGYKVAFHFDPIIYSPTWQRDYTEVVDLIFQRIPVQRIDRISLGTLRMVPQLKKVIENRFPDSSLLDAELIIGGDKKLRYTPVIREQIYKKMLGRIRSYSRDVHVYLCMEEKSICQACQARPLVKEN